METILFGKLKSWGQSLMDWACSMYQGMDKHKIIRQPEWRRLFWKILA